MPSMLTDIYQGRQHPPSAIQLKNMQGLVVVGGRPVAYSEAPARFAQMQINSQNIQLQQQQLAEANRQAQLQYLTALQTNQKAVLDFFENNEEVGKGQYLPKEQFNTLSQDDRATIKSIGVDDFIARQKLNQPTTTQTPTPSSDTVVLPSTGEPISQIEFNKLDPDDQQLLKSVGIDKFNELKQRDVARFNSENIKLDNGDYVSRDAYNKLSDSDKILINKLGAQGFKKQFDDNNVEVQPGKWYDRTWWNALTTDQQNQVRVTGTYMPTNSIKISNGEIVDKDFYNNLSPDDKYYLNTNGVDSYNDKLKTQEAQQQGAIRQLIPYANNAYDVPLTTTSNIDPNLQLIDLSHYQFTTDSLVRYLSVHPNDAGVLANLGFSTDDTVDDKGNIILGLNSISKVSAQIAPAMERITAELNRNEFNKAVWFNTEISNAISAAGISHTLDDPGYQKMKQEWLNASPEQKQTAALDLINNPNNKNQFAAIVNNINRGSDLTSQVLKIAGITTVLNPIAKSVTGQQVSVMEEAEAGATVALYALTFGGGRALQTVLGSTGGKIATSGIELAAGAIYTPSVIQTVRNPEVSGGAKALAVGMDTLLIGGAIFGLRGIGVKSTAGDVVGKVVDAGSTKVSLPVQIGEELSSIKTTLKGIPNRVMTAPEAIKYYSEGLGLKAEQVAEVVKKGLLETTPQIARQVAQNIKEASQDIAKRIMTAPEAIKYYSGTLKIEAAKIAELAKHGLLEVTPEVARKVGTAIKNGAEIVGKRVMTSAEAVDYYVSGLGLKAEQVAKLGYKWLEVTPEVARKIANNIKAAGGSVAERIYTTPEAIDYYLNQVGLKVEQVAELAKKGLLERTPQELFRIANQVKQTAIDMTSRYTAENYVNDISSIYQMKVPERGGRLPLSTTWKNIISSIFGDSTIKGQYYTSVDRVSLKGIGKEDIPSALHELAHKEIMSEDARILNANEWNKIIGLQYKTPFWNVEGINIGKSPIVTIANELATMKYVELISGHANTWYRDTFIKNLYDNVDAGIISAEDAANIIKLADTIAEKTAEKAPIKMSVADAQAKFSDMQSARLQGKPALYRAIATLPDAINYYAGELKLKAVDIIELAKKNLPDVSLSQARIIVEKVKASIAGVGKSFANIPDAIAYYTKELGIQMKRTAKTIGDEVKDTWNEIIDAMQKKDRATVIAKAHNLEQLASEVDDDTIADILKDKAQDIQTNVDTYLSAKDSMKPEDIETVKDAIEVNDKQLGTYYKDLMDKTRPITSEDIGETAIDQYKSELGETRQYKAFEIDQRKINLDRLEKQLNEGTVQDIDEYLNAQRVKNENIPKLEKLGDKATIQDVETYLNSLKDKAKQLEGIDKQVVNETIRDLEEYVKNSKGIKEFQGTLGEGTIEYKPINPEEQALMDAINRDNNRLNEIANLTDTDLEQVQVVNRIAKNMQKLAELRDKTSGVDGFIDAINAKLKNMGFSDHDIAQMSDREKLERIANNIPPEESTGGKGNEPEPPKGGSSGGTSTATETKIETKVKTAEELEKELYPKEKTTEEVKTKEKTGEEQKPAEKTPEVKPEKESTTKTTTTERTGTDTGVEPFTLPRTGGIEHIALVWEDGKIFVKTVVDQPLNEGFGQTTEQPIETTPMTVLNPISGKTSTIGIAKPAPTIPKQSRMLPATIYVTPTKEDESVISGLDPAIKENLSIVTYNAVDFITKLRQENKNDTELDAQTLQYVETKLQQMPQMKSENEVRTLAKLVTQMAVQLEASPVEETQLQTEEEVQAEQQVKQETQTETKTDKVLPLLTRNDTEKIKGIFGKVPVGVLEWRQGAFWEVLPPRDDGTYHEEDIMHLKQPLPGTYRFSTGKGSAYRTIQCLYGVPKNDADVDLGWARIYISTKNRQLHMTVTGGEEAINKRWQEEREREAYIREGLPPELIDEIRERGGYLDIEGNEVKDISQPDDFDSQVEPELESRLENEPEEEEEPTDESLDMPTEEDTLNDELAESKRLQEEYEAMSEGMKDTVKTDKLSRFLPYYDRMQKRKDQNTDFTINEFREVTGKQYPQHIIKDQFGREYVSKDDTVDYVVTQYGYERPDDLWEGLDSLAKQRQQAKDLEELKRMAVNRQREIEQEMAQSTSVQTGLEGFGKTEAQTEMFGEVSGKESYKQPLIEVKEYDKPPEGQERLIPETKEVITDVSSDADYQRPVESDTGRTVSDIILQRDSGEKTPEPIVDIAREPERQPEPIATITEPEVIAPSGEELKKILADYQARHPEIFNVEEKQVEPEKLTIAEYEKQLKEEVPTNITNEVPTEEKEQEKDWVIKNPKVTEIIPEIDDEIEEGNIEVHDIADDIQEAEDDLDQHNEESYKVFPEEAVRSGTLAFRKDNKWWLLRPPYDKENIGITQKIPVGAYKFSIGNDSKFNTIQVLGGKPIENQIIDLGFAVVIINTNGQVVTIYREGKLAGKVVYEKIPKMKTVIDYGLQKRELPQYRRKGLRVYYVNAPFVRSHPEVFPSGVNFTMGGHHAVYQFIPKNEVWIERNPVHTEDIKTIGHELEEKWKMDTTGMDYSEGHNNYANAIETDMRDKDHMPEMTDAIIAGLLNRWEPLQSQRIPPSYYRNYRDLKDEDYNLPKKEKPQVSTYVGRDGRTIYPNGDVYYLGRKLPPTSAGIS